MPTSGYNNEELLRIRWWVSQSNDTVAEIQGQFGNPGEGEHPSLKAVTRKLVKIMTEAICLYVTVIYKV
jgi:hypothetical protein